MLIDTHAHLNFKAFSKDYSKVISDCFKEDIWVINVGSKYETSQKAVQIAQDYEKGAFAAVGLHPIHAKEDFDKEKYKELAKSDRVVAIGETGLDYFGSYGDFKEDQRAVFSAQIKLASELGLPIILHCRKAFDDLISVLSKGPAGLPGVVHCFSGRLKEAKLFLDMGFFLGFNGIIYKLNLREVIKETPLERILLETDCPYLGKEEKNTPLFVEQIAKEVAKIKNIPFEEVALKTTQNAQKLFNI